jgi:hypothetical protein
MEWQSVSAMMRCGMIEQGTLVIKVQQQDTLRWEDEEEQQQEEEEETKLSYLLCYG